MARSPRNRQFTLAGAVLVLGSLLFAVELVYQRSGLFWGDGSSLSGFWSPHSIEGPLLFFLFVGLGGLWVLCFVVGAVAKRSMGSFANIALASAFVLGLAIQFVPYGQWLLAASYVRGMENTPADWWFSAAGHGNKRLLDRFLESGIDINAQSNNGQTALGAAALNGQVEAARILLSKGARPNTPTFMSSETPLMIAAQMDNFEIVKLLVEHGADATMRRSDGCTALNLALRNGNHEMADFLRSHID